MMRPAVAMLTTLQPDRLYVRSCDAAPGSRPEAFTVTLGTYPILGAKQVTLSSIQVPYVPAQPAFPPWACLFSYVVNGSVRTLNLNSIGGGPRPFGSLGDFVSWFNINSGDADVQLGLTDAGKLSIAAARPSAVSIGVPSTDPAYGWVNPAGQKQSANQRLGFTNNSYSLATGWGQPPAVAPEWPCLLRTQTIQVACSLAPVSGMSTSGQTNIIASIPVSVPWLGILTYDPYAIFPVDGISDTIDSVRIELLDERGYPLQLSSQAVVTAEFSLSYQ